MNQSGPDLEAVAKFLDASGAKLDYRRYAETLFDILVAGGMLGELPWTCSSLFFSITEWGHVYIFIFIFIYLFILFECFKL